MSPGAGQPEPASVYAVITGVQGTGPPHSRHSACEPEVTDVPPPPSPDRTTVGARFLGAPTLERRSDTLEGFLVEAQ